MFEARNDGKLYGDISALANCSNLWRLTFFGHINITGDIKSIPGTVYANELSNTKIYGDIADFCLIDRPNLYSFIFSNTQITGNIELLSKYSTLIHIYCDNTPISGSVNPLVNLTKLQRLDVNKPGKNCLIW